MRCRWLLILTLLLSACARPAVPVQVAPPPVPPGSIVATDHPQVTGVTPSAERPWMKSAAFADIGHGWVIMSDGRIHVTADGGKTWSVRPNELKLESLTFVSPTVGWAMAERGKAYFTEDEGQTWTPVDTSGWPADGPVTWLDERHGWTATRKDQLFSTADAGKTWTALAYPCPKDSRNPVSFVSPSTGWLLCGFQEGAGFMSKRLYRTDDGGRTWRMLSESLVGPQGRPSDGHGTPGAIGWGDYVGSLFFLDERHGWYTGGRYGDFMTTADGGLSWKGMPAAGSFRFSTVRFFNLKEGVRWGDGGGQAVGGAVLITRDGGAAWTQVFPAPKPKGPVTSAPGGMLFAAGLPTNAYAILRSGDQGATWQQISELPGETVDQLVFPTAADGWALTSSFTESKMIVSLYRTGDGGRTWTKAPPPPRISYLSAVDATTAFLWDGRDQMFLTRDGGATLTPVGAPSGTEFAHGFQFISPEVGWAARDFKLHATADGGKTWREVPVGTGLKVQSVAVLPSGEVWVVAVDVGKADSAVSMLLSTRDGGKTWTRHELGLSSTDFVPQRLEADRSGVLWLTNGHGGPGLVSFDGGKTWAQR